MIHTKPPHTQYKGAFSCRAQKEKGADGALQYPTEYNSDAVELTGTIEGTSVVEQEGNHGHDGNSQADICDTHEEALFLSVV